MLIAASLNTYMMKSIRYILLFMLYAGWMQAQGISEDLYAFDFKMDDLPIPERVQLFTELGYKGVVFAVRTDGDLEKLEAYRRTDAVRTGKLTIPIVYIPFEFGRDDVAATPIWEKILATSPGTSIWLIITNRNGKATEAKTKELIHRMSAATRKGGVELVLYPHDNTFIESIEEALPYLEEVNEPNVFLTMHLCHEIRAGNGNRLIDVAVKAAPYLKYASISGTNISVNDNSPDWSDAIQPLDQGDFELEKFVSVLQKIKFSGKTVLHTFGIEDQPADHLSRSMKKWKELVKTTYEELNTNLHQILDNPENLYWDKRSRSWFVSSLGGEKVTLEEDGYGWITRLDENGQITANRWVEGLDAPTGMASYGDRLFVGDRGVVVEIDIPTAEIIKKHRLPDSEFINDVAAAPNGDIFISDTFTDRIYRLKDGVVDLYLEDSQLEYPNGLWVDGQQLIVATWGPMTDRTTFATSRKGTLKKVHLKTKAISNLGTGQPIANFDGVVRYGKHYYATDWTGGRLLQISKKGEVKEIVTGFSQFADLGLDADRGILLIPEMSKNRFIKVNLDGL